MTQELVLKGTTAYYERLVPEVKKRMYENKLVFIHDSLLVGCQYNCAKCFSGGSKEYTRQLKEMGKKATNLSEEDRQNMIKEAHDLGAKALVTAGAGEPLLSKDLDKVIEMCSKMDMYVVIFTNGLLLDKEKAEKYLSKNVSIVFSLDSLKEENYNKLTGTKGNLKTVLKHLKDLLEMAEEKAEIVGDYKIVRVAVNTNPTMLTYRPEEGIDEVKEIHEMIDGRATHFVSHITPNAKARENWKMLVGTEDCRINPVLEEAQKKYSKGLGGSSRRDDGKCAYMYNGVVQFAGYWMGCPNVGVSADIGRYPEVNVEQHFKEKLVSLEKSGSPLCISGRG